MSKSKWKFKFISKNVIRFVFFKKSKLKKISKTFIEPLNLMVFKKSSMFMNLLLKDIIYIHRGLYFKIINYNSIFNKFKFGEFVFTRKNFFFPKKVNKNSKDNSKKKK